MDPTIDEIHGVLPGTTRNADPYSTLGLTGDAGVSSGTGTGQQGVVPLIGGTGSVSDAIDDVWEWLNTPFTTPMSPWTMLLMVGVVLVGIIFWNLILYHIRIAAETL